MIEIHRVSTDRWRDMERLFESSGRLRGCWCMIFRAGLNGKVPPPSGGARKKAMRDLVKTDVPVGLLAYADGEPVGWCSVAPRSTFPALAGVGSPDEPVWSITCFYLKAEYRRKGLQRMLLEAAMREATLAGAKALEAYPVEPDSPSYRFGGFIPFFVRAGFREVGRLGSRRHVTRKKLSGSGRPGRTK